MLGMFGGRVRTNDLPMLDAPGEGAFVHKERGSSYFSPFSQYVSTPPILLLPLHASSSAAIVLTVYVNAGLQRPDYYGI